jgi:hypothetical protein
VASAAEYFSIPSLIALTRILVADAPLRDALVRSLEQADPQVALKDYRAQVQAAPLRTLSPQTAETAMDASEFPWQVSVRRAQ